MLPQLPPTSFACADVGVVGRTIVTVVNIANVSKFQLLAKCTRLARQMTG
jgi:hypothetical protein